jgi:hypothetical protein
LLSEYIPNPNILVLTENYLSDIKVAYGELYRTPAQTEKFYQDIKDFYLEVFKLAIHCNESKLYHPTAGELIPSYVHTSLKERLILLSLLPQKQKVKDYIHGLTPGLNNCCARFILPNLRYQISPELFKQVCNAIPFKQIPPKQRHHIITPFENHIWKGHVYVPSKLKDHSDEYLSQQVKFHYSFPDHILLAQVICFLQPNWQQIWYLMNWPRPVQICERLHIFKTVECWTPDLEQTVDFMIKP